MLLKNKILSLIFPQVSRQDFNCCFLYIPRISFTNQKSPGFLDFFPNHNCFDEILSAVRTLTKKPMVGH